MISSQQALWKAIGDVLAVGGGYTGQAALDRVVRGPLQPGEPAPTLPYVVFSLVWDEPCGTAGVRYPRDDEGAYGEDNRAYIRARYQVKAVGKGAHELAARVKGYLASDTCIVQAEALGLQVHVPAQTTEASESPWEAGGMSPGIEERAIFEVDFGYHRDFRYNATSLDSARLGLDQSGESGAVEIAVTRSST